MAEKIFPDGVRAFKPRNGAPDFVKGSIVISPRKLVDWLKANPEFLSEYEGEKQLKLDLMDGTKGFYLSVNTYKKETADKQPDFDDKLPF